MLRGVMSGGRRAQSANGRLLPETLGLNTHVSLARGLSSSDLALMAIANHSIMAKEAAKALREVTNSVSRIIPPPFDAPRP